MNPTATYFFSGVLALVATAAWALASAMSCAEDGYEDALGYHRENQQIVATSSS